MSDFMAKKAPPMQEVVLTNTSTRGESERMYKFFLQAIRKNNTHCTLATIIAIAVAMAIMSVSKIFVAEDVFLTICLMTSVLMLLVVYASVHSMEYECPLEWPAPYVYHKLLEDCQILKSEICEGDDDRFDLCFTISDKDRQVSQTWCKGFEKVIRADINTWTVDLTNRTVFVPYLAT